MKLEWSGNTEASGVVNTFAESNSSKEAGLKPLQLTTDWGFEQFYECDECGAIVRDMRKHEEHHRLRGDYFSSPSKPA